MENFSLTGIPRTFSQEASPSLGKVTGGKGKSEATKAALAQGGMSAGAGLLGGLAQMLTTTDPIDERGRSSIPGGSPGAVHKSAVPTNLTVGRQQFADNPSLALALLQRRG